MEPYFEKTAVLGVGLIGASLSMALKKLNLTGYVTGYGRTEANLIKAKELSVIDAYEHDPRRACDGADLVVFSTPVGLFTSIANEIKSSVKKDAVVIDVGSVKGGLVYEMEKLLGNRFVGCHPIAGSEQSGIGAANPGLFDSALCVITRTGNTEPSALDKVVSLWETLGSKVVVMGTEEHDRIFGLVSHLPHMVAYALVNTVAGVEPEYLKYAGKGFRDTTRIAASSPELWRDICLMNRENILRFIDCFMRNLEGLRLKLKDGDAEALQSDFGKARDHRKGIDKKPYGAH